MPTKAQLRDRARTRVQAMRPADRTAASGAITDRVLALPEVIAARSVFCFCSIDGEVTTDALIDRLLDGGHTVSVPVIRGPVIRGPGWRGPGQMTAAIITSRTQLAPGRWGIPAPRHPGPRDTAPDVTLCPGLAFANDGTRLGRGGGYYDRYLAAHPRTRAVGVCFGCALTDALPRQPHDRAMAVVVTESRVIRA